MLRKYFVGITNRPKYTSFVNWYQGVRGTTEITPSRDTPQFHPLSTAEPCNHMYIRLRDITIRCGITYSKRDPLTRTHNMETGSVLIKVLYNFSVSSRRESYANLIPEPVDSLLYLEISINQLLLLMSPNTLQLGTGMLSDRYDE